MVVAIHNVAGRDRPRLARVLRVEMWNPTLPSVPAGRPAVSEVVRWIEAKAEFSL